MRSGSTTTVSRRRVLKALTGGAAAVGTAGTVDAQGDGNESDSGASSETVAVGPDGEYVFRPGTDDPLVIAPGTTVNFVWESDNHNIVVDEQPEDANWNGHEPIENTGFEYSHTFDVEGQYHYYCSPTAVWG